MTSNILDIANEWKNYGIKNIFVSDRTINNRVNSDFVNFVNNA